MKKVFLLLFVFACCSCRPAPPTPLEAYLLEHLPSGVDPITLIEEPSLAPEGFRLTIREDDIEIAGADYGGIFNGIQELFRLLPPEVYAKKGFDGAVELPCQEISDAPCFTYRAQHLDVARTFMTVEEVKRYIDLFAYHRLNTLHWHLTDDEGWRIEIKSHPELAQIGGFRGGDSPIQAIYGKWDERYGGYYTQDQIRDIVAYASVRHIEIIPEIDLPGHSRAIARVMPEILCPYTPDLTPSNGYDLRSAWCVSREENYALLDDILGEVASLFPSEYIHIGGDEVQFTEWEPCPECGKLKHPQQLFMQRVIDILKKHQKEPAVWDEAFSGGGLDKRTRVHGWQNVKVCRQSASQGYPTVVMPAQYFYFDMRQSPTEEGHSWAAVFDVTKVASFDFEKQGFTDAEMEHVIGVEGAFWNELGLAHSDPSLQDYIDYMLFPRLYAVSELGWTGRGPTAEQLLAHEARMHAMGINYRPYDFQPPTPLATLNPAVKMTSSIPFSPTRKTRTTRTALSGDWVLFTFAKPLTCSEIRIHTGYPQLHHPILHGDVEVSHDGETFTRVGALENGCYTLHNPQKVKSIRLTSTRNGNGWNAVIVQPLLIRK